MIPKYKRFIPKNDIKSICEKFGIEKYVINPNNSISVEEDVYLHGHHISKIPLNFKDRLEEVYVHMESEMPKDLSLKEYILV